MAADVLSFPKKRAHVALALLKVARSHEERALQRDAIALMALELKEARYAALVAQKALDALGGGSDDLL